MQQALKVKPVLFYTADKKQSTAVAIPTIDEISIQKNGRFEKRVVRYCIGEKSIYKDEQSDTARQAPSIYIRDGFITLSPYESTKISYLRTTDYNGSNPNRNPNKDILFYEHNPEEKASKSLAEERQEVEARSKVFQLELEEVKAFCSAIGVQNVDDLSEDEMRHNMLMYAKTRPSEFIQFINDMPTMKRKYHVNQALTYKIIEKRGQSLFTKSGDLICTVPAHEDTIDYFVEKSYSIYKMEYENILKALFPKKETLVEDEESKEKELTLIVKKAMDDELISWNREMMTFVIVFKDEVVKLGKTASSIEKSILKNEDLLAYLKSI